MKKQILVLSIALGAFTVTGQTNQSSDKQKSSQQNGSQTGTEQHGTQKSSQQNGNQTGTEHGTQKGSQQNGTKKGNQQSGTDQNGTDQNGTQQKGSQQKGGQKGTQQKGSGNDQNGTDQNGTQKGNQPNGNQSGQKGMRQNGSDDSDWNSGSNNGSSNGGYNGSNSGSNSGGITPPSSVSNKFNTENSGTNATWHMDGENYSAEYMDKKSSLGKNVVYDRNGNIIRTDNEMTPDGLNYPSSIGDYHNTNFPNEGYKVWQTDDGKGNKYYYTKRQNGTIWFDKDGKFIPGKQGKNDDKSKTTK